jgi:predicted CXXCH cytochrome family protein
MYSIARRTELTALQTRGAVPDSYLEETMSFGFPFTIASLALCSVALADDRVGLSLLFQNGAAAPIKLVGDHSRYLQEVDIAVTSPPTSSDLGIQPIRTSGEFAGLNWTGVQMVEEDWRPDGAGKFTRQRFYRGAYWMKSAGLFMAIPVNANNIPVGLPLIALTGFDESRSIADDGFVRRFNARQIATGCPAINDCTGASFIAQGLVQWRHNLRASDRALKIPHTATKLRLLWSEQPTVFRDVPVTHHASGAFPFGYGFVPTLSVVDPPANGQFYQTGENVKLRVTLKDGQGTRLHPVGSLPTLADTLSGADPAGIRYFNPSLIPTLYYAFKHREANTLVGLLGPVHKLKVSNHVVQISDFFLPQVPTSTTADGGWTGLGWTIPPPLVAFGILPATTPVPDTVTFTIPADAEAGTYVASYKGRREFGGEALNRGATLDIKVGTNSPLPFTAATGPCTSCHQNASAIPNVLHGIGDRRVCFTCHTGLAFEPDNPLDIRVHTVHDRSKRFDSSMQNCAQCHLTTPSGPARGLLQ